MPKTIYTLEERFFRKTYSNILWRVNNEKELVGLTEFTSAKQLEEHWNNQKEKYGMKCPYTGIEMQIPDIRNKNRSKDKVKGKRKYVDNNVAVDQIWPGKGYTFMNTVFCSYKFNREKNKITPDGCQAVIDLYNLRTKIFLKKGYQFKQEERMIKSEIDTIEEFIEEVTKTYTFDGELVTNPKTWFKKLKKEVEKRKEKIKNLPVMNYYGT